MITVPSHWSPVRRANKTKVMRKSRGLRFYRGARDSSSLLKPGRSQGMVLQLALLKAAVTLHRTSARRKSIAEIECELESSSQGVARCWAEISGTRLLVDFPLEILRKLRLSPGSHFLWKVREGEPRPSDFSLKEKETFHPDEELLRDLNRAIQERRSGAWVELSKR